MSKILVSGTSRGLGYALAAKLSQNHSVVGFARSELSTENKFGKFRHLAGVDVNDQGTWIELKDHFSDTDSLIVNHGVAFDGLLATQDAENISRVISSNLTSSLLLAKEYIRARMKVRTSGNIVFVTSIIASRGYSGLASYSASKAGLEGAARSMARELGPKGFRVNCVAPGYFDSDLSSSLDAIKKAQIIRRTPLGRLAEPSDIIPSVEFLISEDARFITGNVITIDGGISV